MTASEQDSPGHAARVADAPDGARLSHYPDLVKAHAMVKLATARAGVDCGTARHEILDGIERACLEAIDGKPSPFPLDVFQDDAGIALRVGIALGNRRLVTAIKGLIASCRAKGQEFGSLLKKGGSQFPAAAPLTQGSAFTVLGDVLAGEVRTLEAVQHLLCGITLRTSGNATDAHPPIGYTQRFASHLATVSRLPISLLSEPIQATADPFGIYSSCMKRLASTLLTVCNDLRLVASLPRFGRREGALSPKPAVSRIMPGTVKPMVPEMANAAGPAPRNVVDPAIVTSIFEAQTLFINAVHVLRLQYVDGITAKPDVCRGDADSMLVAVALATLPGLGSHTATATAPGTTGSGCSTGPAQADWLFMQAWQRCRG